MAETTIGNFRAMVVNTNSPSLSSDNSSGLTARTDSSLITDSSNDSSVAKALVNLVSDEQVDEDDDDVYDDEDDDETHEAATTTFTMIDKMSDASSSVRHPNNKKQESSPSKTKVDRGDTGSSSSINLLEHSLRKAIDPIESIVAGLTEAARQNVVKCEEENRAKIIEKEHRIAAEAREEEAWTANQTIHQINQSASLQIDKSKQKII